MGEERQLRSMANFLNLVNGFSTSNDFVAGANGDDEGIFTSAMGSYLGPDGYFHSASEPFPDTTLDFTFPTTDTDNTNYYSRNNSSNDNLPSFPDTFGPTNTSHVGHPDSPPQVPYSGYFPGFVSQYQYQYRTYGETQTLSQPAQFQQPSLPLPLPNPNFGGGNNYPFCGGFDQSESPSGLISSNPNLNLNPIANSQGYHPFSSSSALLPAQEFDNLDNPSPVPVQGQSQVQQCACAPLRPQDLVDPPSNNSPSHSFDNNIDFGSSSSSSDVYHLLHHNHNHQPPTISGTLQPPSTQQQPLSLINQNTYFGSINSANIPSTINSVPGQEPASDDYYVSALASANFSSPSLPPLNSSPFAAVRTQTQLTEPSSSPQPDFGSEMPGAMASSTAPGGLAD
ncbi:hypothetical protein PG994_010231 [Apiospora phragmitis]|uniref:Uncharacterized protein n=1 Tax=Apiospora phragmitis TaxID=2905665 RepID=A0ABR1TRI8_9PEZI